MLVQGHFGTKVQLWDNREGESGHNDLEYMDAIYLPHMQVQDHLKLQTQTVQLCTRLCDPQGA